MRTNPTTKYEVTATLVGYRFEDGETHSKPMESQTKILKLKKGESDVANFQFNDFEFEAFSSLRNLGKGATETLLQLHYPGSAGDAHSEAQGIMAAREYQNDMFLIGGPDRRLDGSHRDALGIVLSAHIVPN